MSSWLEEIGNQKFTDKEISFMIKILDVMKDELDPDDDLKDGFLEMVDNAAYNINKLKEALNK